MIDTVILFTFTHQHHIKVFFSDVVNIYYPNKYFNNELFLVFLLTLKNIKSYKKSELVKINFFIELIQKHASRLPDGNKNTMLNLANNLINLKNNVIFTKYDEPSVTSINEY